MMSKSIILCSAILFSYAILEGSTQASGNNGKCNGEKAMRNNAKKESEPCRELMSEETAELFDDDDEYDNLEVREFLVCLYAKLGYYAEATFNQDVMATDIDYYFCDGEINSKFKAAVEFCIENELPDSDVDTDLIGAFTKCLNDKKKSDM